MCRRAIEDAIILIMMKSCTESQLFSMATLIAVLNDLKTSNNGNGALDCNQLWSKNRTKLGSLLGTSEDTKDDSRHSALDGYQDGILLVAKLVTVNGDVLESDNGLSLG